MFKRDEGEDLCTIATEMTIPLRKRIIISENERSLNEIVIRIH